MHISSALLLQSCCNLLSKPDQYPLMLAEIWGSIIIKYIIIIAVLGGVKYKIINAAFSAMYDGFMFCS